MAGGKGERLSPLTRERSKPAVPFGGRYRVIDFVLSNFVNSGILSLYVLVQYKSQSLIFNVFPPDTVIGEDPAEDGRRWVRDDSGIVVVPRGGRAHVLDMEGSV
jgi:UTP-glucose-1-phosphate uridylyltransferase